MSVLQSVNGDESPECPLCMEYLELDDINFYPCSCGYQICRFCWNKIRTEGAGLCPACRSAYSENPADFKPLTVEELAKIKAEKRQKDVAKKLKISENRKHLSNVRVVQKNLVFVVGLSSRIADPDILRKTEYFGKFGKIHKVVLNHSTSYAGNQNQGPSASAYVTYLKSEDALKAIQTVNNIFIDGRTLKASLGTTKYCSHFMKNQSCPKHDCMYLHELGDENASFTKEEMQQGKHTDYERSLHEEMMLAQSQSIDFDKNEEERSNSNESSTSNAGSGKDSWPNLTKNSFQGLEDRRDDEDQIVESSSASSSSSLPAESPFIVEPSSDPLYKTVDLQKWVAEDEEKEVLSTDEEDDDLGFDPFHETQKALAEMLESESKLFQEVSQVSIESPSSSSSSSSSSLSSYPSYNHPPRSKLPPPGFNNLNNLSNGDLSRFLPGKIDHFSSNGYGNDYHRSYHQGNHYGRHNEKYPKDWQDGLRALLPNINVSFGALPNNCQPNEHRQEYSSVYERVHSSHLQQQPKQQQHRPGWQIANDWTVLDPAIVGGQISDSRSESPPNWIKANLEQLTESPSNSSFNHHSHQVGSLLPSLANLGLSSGDQPRGWTGTPPPGFSRASLQNQYSNNLGNVEGHTIELLFEKKD